MTSKFGPGRINETLYPLTVIVSGLLFYLLATGNTGWYFYVGLSFLVFERAIVAFITFIARLADRRIMAVLAKMAEARAAESASGDPTLGPIHGGAIEPPEDDDAKQ